MNMNCLSVENLTKSFGENVLFQNLNFGIEKGQKVALVAANGTGKSTLLNILTGKEAQDEGVVAFNKEITVDILDQEPDFRENDTIEDFIFRGENPMLETVKLYESALSAYENDPSDAKLELLNEATNQMERFKAWFILGHIFMVL